MVFGGEEAHNVQDNHEKFDAFALIWDGKLVFGSFATDTLIRATIIALFECILSQVIKPNVSNSVANGSITGPSGGNDEEKFQEKPSTSDRRDIAEILAAMFRVGKSSAAGLFIHQSSVSCALGAVVATYTVVDIGHYSTKIACVEDSST